MASFLHFTPEERIDTRGRVRKMSDKVADLMLRNLQEVFNEKDAARRIVAVKSIYAEEAEFFEGDERIEGHDAISAKVGALQASFPPDFTFAPTSAPARNHDVGRLPWRVGPAAAAPPVATGMDVAVFEQGKVRALYVFLDQTR
jgi:hypothetical protein